MYVPAVDDPGCRSVNFGFVRALEEDGLMRKCTGANACRRRVETLSWQNQGVRRRIAVPLRSIGRLGRTAAWRRASTPARSLPRDSCTLLPRAGGSPSFLPNLGLGRSAPDIDSAGSTNPTMALPISGASSRNSRVLQL
ncbi:unnamed protein product, partial [Iphiclides podalirius]